MFRYVSLITRLCLSLALSPSPPPLSLPLSLCVKGVACPFWGLLQFHLSAAQVVSEGNNELGRLWWWIGYIAEPVWAILSAVGRGGRDQNCEVHFIKYYRDLQS